MILQLGISAIWMHRFGIIRCRRQLNHKCKWNHPWRLCSVKRVNNQRLSRRAQQNLRVGRKNQNMINWTKKEESESRGTEGGHREVFKEDWWCQMQQKDPWRERSQDPLHLVLRSSFQPHQECFRRGLRSGSQPKSLTGSQEVELVNGAFFWEVEINSGERNC